MSLGVTLKGEKIGESRGVQIPRDPCGDHKTGHIGDIRLKVKRRVTLKWKEPWQMETWPLKPVLGWGSSDLFSRYQQDQTYRGHLGPDFAGARTPIHLFHLVRAMSRCSRSSAWQSALSIFRLCARKQQADDAVGAG